MSSYSKSSVFACLLFVSFILLSCAPSGQILLTSTKEQDLAGKSRLVGIITDVETGEPLVGANIDIEELHVQHVRKLHSYADINGKFAIDNIPDGHYEVLVSIIGYKKLTHLDLTLQPNQIVTIHCNLEATKIQVHGVY